MKRRNGEKNCCSDCLQNLLTSTSGHVGEISKRPPDTLDGSEQHQANLRDNKIIKTCDASWLHEERDGKATQKVHSVMVGSTPPHPQYTLLEPPVGKRDKKKPCGSRARPWPERSHRERRTLRQGDPVCVPGGRVLIWWRNSEVLKKNHAVRTARSQPNQGHQPRPN